MTTLSFPKIRSEISDSYLMPRLLRVRHRILLPHQPALAHLWPTPFRLSLSAFGFWILAACGFGFCLLLAVGLWSLAQTTVVERKWAGRIHHSVRTRHRSVKLPVSVNLRAVCAARATPTACGERRERSEL